MHNLTLAQMSESLAKGETTSLALTEHFLNRIEKLNPTLNAFITVTPETALAQAKLADQTRKSGKASKLCGIPMAHKDIFCTKGIKTSCGSKMLDKFISPYDATLVHQLNQQGMVMLGKTNMDEFAMGSSNETSFYGPCKNPWKLEAVPGGSSGGSSSCVAARLAPMATGTDTGGSIRQPAALTGITGIKPTYGRVSRYGMVAFASSLDQAGPMARTAEDCALVLEAMAGFDKKDSTSVDESVPTYSQHLNNSLKGLKIGLPVEYFEKGLDESIRKRVDEVIAVYKDLGAEFKEISLKNSPLSVPVYYIVASAEASSNLSRFDGVRYGHRCDQPKDLADLYFRSRGEGFGPEVKRRIMMGTYTLSAGFYDAYYSKAQKVRHLISDDFKKAFESVDLILGPTAPTTAFNIGEKIDDPVSMYLNDIYTIAANLAGLPALSAPAGMVNDMPCGFQLIGNFFQESKILNAAHQYQKQTEWHLMAPKGFD